MTQFPVNRDNTSWEVITLKSMTCQSVFGFFTISESCESLGRVGTDYMIKPIKLP